MSEARFHLCRSAFGEVERPAVDAGDLRATLFRYPTGIEAVRLANRRGSVVVLPFMGQMIWQATFDGVDLAMRSMFEVPRPAREIAGTYGCLAFHSGLLRNGVPGPEDTHPAHGEMPCAAMDAASVVAGEDGEGAFLRLEGSVEYAMGFGAHYLARPGVTLRADRTVFGIDMAVENLSGAPMDLMYMAHVNFAYAEAGRIVQPAPFTPEATVVRREVPVHVAPNPDYLRFIEELAADPSPSAALDAPERYDPEQVFYVRDPATDAKGGTRFLLRRAEGDAFSIAYRPEEFPKTVRWIMANSDQAVCAVALPSTCEPEGYAAEKRKGNVRRLDGRATARFSVELGYLDASAAADAAHLIGTLGKA